MECTHGMITVSFAGTLLGRSERAKTSRDPGGLIRARGIVELHLTRSSAAQWVELRAYDNLAQRLIGCQVGQCIPVIGRFWLQREPLQPHTVAPHVIVLAADLHPLRVGVRLADVKPPFATVLGVLAEDAEARTDPDRRLQGGGCRGRGASTLAGG